MKPIALAALLLAPLSAQGAIVLHLALDSSKTLPSVPVGITITAENTGVTPVTLPPIVWMRLDPGNGQATLLPASQSSDGPDGVAIAPGLRTVPGQTTRTICRIEPTLFLTGTPWFDSKMISGPGAFVLQAILSDDVPDVTNSSIVSNQVRLTAAAATQEDRAAWAWLLAKGSGNWNGISWATSSWADEMLARFPESNYAPYALAFVTGIDLDERDRLARRILRTFPHFALADDLKLELARQHRQRFLLLEREDSETALRHADAARALATDVATHSVSADRRTAAGEILAHTPSREGTPKPRVR